MSSTYLPGHLTNFHSHLSIGFLGNNVKKCLQTDGSQWSGKSAPCVAMTTPNIKCIAGFASLVAQLRSDWSHLSGLFKGTRAHLTCLTRQGTPTRADIHTHANAHSWSEMAYGRHAVLRLQTGESGDVRRRERELQTGSGGRISPSLHDNPLILSYTVKQQFCLPLSLSASLYVINASVSQRTCDTYVGINIILVLCEDVRGW